MLIDFLLASFMSAEQIITKLLHIFCHFLFRWFFFLLLFSPQMLWLEVMMMMMKFLHLIIRYYVIIAGADKPADKQAGRHSANSIHLVKHFHWRNFIKNPLPSFNYNVQQQQPAVVIFPTLQTPKVIPICWLPSLSLSCSYTAERSSKIYFITILRCSCFFLNFLFFF